MIRGSYGLFYDRVPLRALANALLSAGNTTDHRQPQPDQHQSFARRKPARRCFPNILSSLTLPPGVLFNFTTMNRNMQNAYSEQGSFEIEQQLGRNNTLSVGYQHVRGLHLIISVNQNVPACVASGNNNGCRPNPDYGNNSQYSPRADSHYDGLHVSFVQRPARWGNYRVSYTYSKALDNVGEFFFSSPIDNFNIWQDYGRSDDDQRHRLVFDGTIHSPMATRRHSVGADQPRLSIGKHAAVLLGAAVQHHDRSQHDSGNNRPADGQWGIHQPQCRNRFRLLQRERAAEPDVSGTTERLRVEAIAEAFNLFNHVNGVALNGSFGSGAYPTNPLSDFQTESPRLPTRGRCSLVCAYPFRKTG